MDRHSSHSRLRSQIQAYVRLYQAASGTAIGLASVSQEGLDQSWRDRVQRIRALPREAPRRKQMIEAVLRLIEQTLWNTSSDLDVLAVADPSLAAEALVIAQRGRPTEAEATAPSSPTSEG